MNQEILNRIFKENPELSEIGTKTQYLKYLKTIFSDSKYKRFAYHHSEEKLQKFKDNFFEGYAAKHGVSPKAIFFLKKPIAKEFLSKRNHLILCKLNLKKPFQYKNKFKTSTYEAKANPGIKEGIDYALKEKYDSVIFSKIWDNRTWCDVLTVFSSKQVHIIGSKKDIIGFRRFLSDKK